MTLWSGLIYKGINNSCEGHDQISETPSYEATKDGLLHVRFRLRHDNRSMGKMRQSQPDETFKCVLEMRNREWF